LVSRVFPSIVARTPLKMIIQSEPHQIRCETVIRCGHRELAIVEIEIKPLSFGGPMLREAHFNTEAGDPAQAAMLSDRFPDVIPVSSP